MKTWICMIFGGGTPLYLVSAENEFVAWNLIKRELRKTPGYCGISFELEKNSGGLIEFPYFTSNEEVIIDIHDVYAPKGLTKRGSYHGL